MVSLESFDLNSCNFCRKPDWEVVLRLALRRLKIEVYMGGGKVSDSLSDATHWLILSVPGFDVDYENVLRR